MSRAAFFVLRISRTCNAYLIALINFNNVKSYEEVLYEIVNFRFLHLL